MWPKIFSPKGTSRGTAYLFIPNKATNLQNLGYIITLVFSYKYNSTAHFNPKAKSHYCKRLPAPLSLMLLFIKPKTYPLFLEIRHSDVQLFFLKLKAFPCTRPPESNPVTRSTRAAQSQWEGCPHSAALSTVPAALTYAPEAFKIRNARREWRKAG